MSSVVLVTAVPSPSSSSLSSLPLLLLSVTYFLYSDIDLPFSPASAPSLAFLACVSGSSSCSTSLSSSASPLCHRCFCLVPQGPLRTHLPIWMGTIHCSLYVESLQGCGPRAPPATSSGCPHHSACCPPPSSSRPPAVLEAHLHCTSLASFLTVTDTFSFL